MENDCVKEKIIEALRLFISRDKQQLLEVDIYEPTLSHRIAVYLEDLFPEHDVDCEYNKNLSDPKKDVNGKRIRPDIIIHKRKNSDNNSVIIEVKKNGKDSKLARADIIKLKGCIQGSLNYNIGVFIGILKRRVDICWIEKSNNHISETFEILPLDSVDIVLNSSCDSAI
mgnify:CR=1 FL=1